MLRGPVNSPILDAAIGVVLSLAESRIGRLYDTWSLRLQEVGSIPAKG